MGQRTSMTVQNRWFRLGRSSLSDWQFEDDPKVSSAHAVIVWNGGYQIRDLGSRNRTLVNGVMVEECSLTSGDEVRLGPSGPRLLFEIPMRTG